LVLGKSDKLSSGVEKRVAPADFFVEKKEKRVL